MRLSRALGTRRAYTTSTCANELFRNAASNLSGPVAKNALPILIESGTLIDGNGSEPIPNQSVLIHGDIILAVGTDAVTEAQSSLNQQDIKRIDAKGKYILPGLIDSHCHVSFLEPSSNDELFFHRQSEGLTAILAAQSAKKLLLAGCTGTYSGAWSSGLDEAE